MYLAISGFFYFLSDFSFEARSNQKPAIDRMGAINKHLSVNKNF